MPIYEYQCSECGRVSEVLVFGKEDGAACRHCGSTALTKLMSAHNTMSSAPSAAAPDCSCCGSQNMCGAPGSCGAPGTCCGN
jgi:putative FmdB family regulatory protein